MRTLVPRRGLCASQRFGSRSRWLDAGLRLQRRLGACGRGPGLFALMLGRKQRRRREHIRQSLVFALLRKSEIRNLPRRSAVPGPVHRHLISMAHQHPAMAVALRPGVRVVPRLGGGARPLMPSLADRREPGARSHASKSGLASRSATTSLNPPVGMLGPAIARRHASLSASPAPRWSSQARNRWRPRDSRSSPLAATLDTASPRLAGLRVERKHPTVATDSLPSRLLPHARRLPPASSEGRDIARRVDAVLTRSATRLRVPPTARRAAGRTDPVRRASWPASSAIDRGAFAPPAEPRTRVARGAQRVEHPVQPFALEVMRPRSHDGKLRGGAPGPTMAAQPRSHPQPQAARSAARLAEVENAIAATLQENIERRIVAVVKETISSDEECSQKLTDRVCGSLYDRLILERERLG